MTPAYKVECQIKGIKKAEYVFASISEATMFQVAMKKKGYNTHMSFKDLDKEKDEWNTL